MEVLQVLADAALDTLKVLPILMIAYVLVEWAEHALGHKQAKLLSGKAAPLFGAAVGLLPQCGFSVAATDFYSKGRLTTGTLLAVYLSTSDEAVPVLLAHPDRIGLLLPVLLSKFVFACVVGFCTDLFFPRKVSVAEETPQEEIPAVQRYLKEPLLRTLKVGGFLLLVNCALGLILFAVGEDRLKDFLTAGEALQPLFCALVGLIPNCGASVALMQLYLSGGLRFGACIGGLCVNAGVALGYLFKSNANKKENFAILAAQFLLGVAYGYFLLLFPL